MLDVVFVHGWGFNSSVWQNVASSLKNVNLHFIDLEFIDGFKSSPLIPNHAIWVGHSLGVMWILKNLKPNHMPKGLVSINGFDCFYKYIPIRQIQTMQLMLDRDPWSQLNTFWQSAGHIPNYAQNDLRTDCLKEGLNWLELWSGEVELKKLSCPILGLASQDDAIIPAAMTHSIWKDYPLQMYKTGGHVLPLTEANWCADHIQRFIYAL